MTLLFFKDAISLPLAIQDYLPVAFFCDWTVFYR